MDAAGCTSAGGLLYSFYRSDRYQHTEGQVHRWYPVRSGPFHLTALTETSDGHVFDVKNMSTMCGTMYHLYRPGSGSRVKPKTYFLSFGLQCTNMFWYLQCI